MPMKTVVQKKTWRIMLMAEGEIDKDRERIAGEGAHMRCRRKQEDQIGS